MSDEAIHDIFVIGGGINGCGIARDAVQPSSFMAACGISNITSFVWCAKH